MKDTNKKAPEKKPPYIQYSGFDKNGQSKKEIATSGNWEHYRTALLELIGELNEFSNLNYLAGNMELSDWAANLSKHSLISAGEVEK